MHLFHDSTLNTWRLITEKLPEKPVLDNYLDVLVYQNDIEKYGEGIAALKHNALTVVNEELIAKGIDMDLETVRNVLWHGELIHWPGAYETKEKDIFVEAGGNYIHTETITVAILTLPEEKIEVHGTESGKLFIKPEDLFALSKVQETIKKAATRAEEKKNTMENMTKSTKAIKTCAEWLSYCLSIGWEKEQLDGLEKIWWENHDEKGNLTASGSVAAPKEEEELCPTCGSAWGNINGMYCSDSWHLATPLIQKQVARLQSDLSASKESIKELLAILEPTDHPYGIINMYHRCKAHEHLLPKAKEKLDHAKALLDKK